MGLFFGSQEQLHECRIKLGSERRSRFHHNYSFSKEYNKHYEAPVPLGGIYPKESKTES